MSVMVGSLGKAFSFKSQKTDGDPSSSSSSSSSLIPPSLPHTAPASDDSGIPVSASKTPGVIAKNQNQEQEQDQDQEQDRSCGDESGDGSNEAFALSNLLVGPPVSLQAQIERDKDDESLCRWKEQLLGKILLGSVEEPEVKARSLNIMSEGRPDILITFPLASPAVKGRPLFTLKEGSSYCLKFSFTVCHNIVPGLVYHNTVWKNGIRVDSSRVMLGTFAPQSEPYTHIMEEEVTPSGIFARGSYTARTKFVDDDGRCHWEIEHTFDIRKDWAQ